jgi:hypothetical protein
MCVRREEREEIPKNLSLPSSYVNDGMMIILYIQQDICGYKSFPRNFCLKNSAVRPHIRLARLCFRLFN